MSRKKTGREGLLVWLQSRTRGYENVNVIDFTDSWVDGLAFCALLHSFCPDLIKYGELKPTAQVENLELAFTIAEKLGIPKLIEPADMLNPAGPDKFFVITYLAQFVDYFRHPTNEPPECLTPPTTTIKYFKEQYTGNQHESERKSRLRRSLSKCFHRVKGGTITDTIKELKRQASSPRLNTPRGEIPNGTVNERIEEFKRKTGAKHTSGDSFLIETIPTGLVAQRISSFLKLQKQIKLEIEYIMISSPKTKSRKHKEPRSRALSDGDIRNDISKIYYIMKTDQGESSLCLDQSMPDGAAIADAMLPVIEPLALE